MKKHRLFATIIFAFVLFIMLGGCGSRSISGIWEHGIDSDVYFVFGRRNSATLNIDGNSISGSYNLSGRHIRIRFYYDGHLVIDESGTLTNDRNAFNWGSDVFVRSGSGRSSFPWWGWILGLAVLGIVGNVINSGDKRVTDKGLE